MSKVSIHEQKISRLNNDRCFGRLILNKNQLTIRTLGLRGFFNRSIPLRDVKSVTAVPSTRGDNVFVTTTGGEIIGVRMNKGSMLMSHVINEHLGQFEVSLSLPDKKAYRRAV